MAATLDLRATMPGNTPVQFAALPGAGLSAPDPAREARLLRAVRSLAQSFAQSAAEQLGGRKWFSHFESWLWAARAKTSSGGVVPPLPPAVADAASAELSRKLVRSGMGEPEAARLCSELAGKARTLYEQWSREPPSASAAPVTLAPITGSSGQADEGSRLMGLTCAGVEVRCSERHLVKLRGLFETRVTADEARRRRKRKRGAHGGPGGGEGAAEEHASGDFEACAFCVLARLLALQGGDERAGGMQGQSPPAVARPNPTSKSSALPHLHRPSPQPRRPQCRADPVCQARALLRSSTQYDPSWASPSSFSPPRSTRASRASAPPRAMSTPPSGRVATSSRCRCLREASS